MELSRVAEEERPRNAVGRRQFGANRDYTAKKPRPKIRKKLHSFCSQVQKSSQPSGLRTARYGIAAEAWFEYGLSLPLESTAVGRYVVIGRPASHIGVGVCQAADQR